MKCPHCGNESRTKDVCSSCGEKVEMPEQTIEVEYKEFKVSEFMEIRRKRKSSRRKGDETTLTEEPGTEEKDYRNAGETGIATVLASLLPRGKRKRFLIAGLVIVVLSVIAGTYYFLKLWHNQ
jgi:hypothetical protein